MEGLPIRYYWVPTWMLWMNLNNDPLDQPDKIWTCGPLFDIRHKWIRFVSNQSVIQEDLNWIGSAPVYRKKNKYYPTRPDPTLPFEVPTALNKGFSFPVSKQAAASRHLGRSKSSSHGENPTGAEADGGEG